MDFGTDRARQTRRSLWRTVVSLLVPWAFVVGFAYAYHRLLWPRFFEGGVPALVAVVVAIVLATSVVAALTVSRDVLRGHFP